MNSLLRPIPAGYDQEKIGNYVVPDQNPILKRLFPFRNIPLPEPGYWLVRIHRKGPWNPAAILRLRTKHEPGNLDNRMERSPFLAAFISGEVVSLEDVWHRRGRPMLEVDYWDAVSEIEYARRMNEYDPRLHPNKPMQLGAISV